MKSTIAKLVDQLPIDGHDKKHAVVAGLLGEAETVVTSVEGINKYTYIVLDKILDHCQLRNEMPILVRQSKTLSNKVVARLKDRGWANREKEITTAEVANWFISRANGFIDSDADRFTETCAPFSASSFAQVTMSGDLGDLLGITDDHNFDGNKYGWHDLNDTPVGGSVYRISSTRTLWLFTKQPCGELWEVRIQENIVWPDVYNRTYETRNFGDMLEGALIALRAQKVPV